MTDEPIEQQTTPADTLLQKLQPYQNIIFFVVLIIFLGVILLVWRGYRARIANRQAWEDLMNVQLSSEYLKGLEQRYKNSDALPMIRFRLATALAYEGNFSEAKKVYEAFIKDYPDYLFRTDAEQALKRLESNEKWASGELERQKAELRVKRNLPYVTVKTVRGNFEVELYEDEAPNTVANFIALCEAGAYSPTPFTEIKTDLGLCFGYSITPTFTIPFEDSGLNNEEGSIGMIRELDPEAKAGNPDREGFLNSADMRFYISLKTNPDIDGKYTVFGKVIKGMDTVRLISKENSIINITIDLKRNHPYKPNRISR